MESLKDKNLLFVVDKPINISSRGYINRLKRVYGSKIGFAGTLDPFASGSLIIATNRYTKLFNYLDKSPKRYLATLWLGAESRSLDLENIVSIKDIKRLKYDEVDRVFNSLKGDITYTPPKFSAKKIAGKRAYRLAREEREVKLKEITSTIYDIELLLYNHPFIHFDISISEGGYIRSVGEIISKKLGVVGTLSSLRRVKEGRFSIKNRDYLNPLNYLKPPRNIYRGDIENIKKGKVLNILDFELKDDGEYIVTFENQFSIIELKRGLVKYRLNSIRVDI
jgi:tRNA pseudouridine55 synthase